MEIDASSEQNYTLAELYEFIKTAAGATYAGNGEYVENPEREGHFELVFGDPNGKFEYRDSFAGHLRSQGTEVVRINGKPIWESGYRGGMILGQEELANKTFEFLKLAMKTKEEGFLSFRGPHLLKEGPWRYEYTQDGTLEEFMGQEEIYHGNDLVFYHTIIGGTIR